MKETLVPEPLTILLVEDDWSVRSAVRDYLTKRDMAVYEADCLETALAVADTIRPDASVIDIVLPERGGERADFDRHVGIQVARQLRDRLPQMGIVFLSAYMDRGPEVIQLFMEGHDRIVYLLKGSKPKELLDAIYRVTSGASGLEIAAGVRTAHQTTFDVALGMLTNEERTCVTTALDKLQTLSETEWRVFEAVGRCRTRQQAAEELSIGTKTISSHMDAIYDKLCLREQNRGLNPLMLLAKIHLLHHLQYKDKDTGP
jgi:two-component system invasion response regulator UvrY